LSICRKAGFRIQDLGLFRIQDSVRKIEEDGLPPASHLKSLDLDLEIRI
jgi:hypothetical protein